MPDDFLNWEWLAENAALVQAAVGIVTALVWVVYLQILVSGVRRQRRSGILIHSGGSRNLDARVFVSNLGFEPIYILEILLSLQSRDGATETSIVDRTEKSSADASSNCASTFQGPLESGKFVDIGSFEDLLQRARQNTSSDFDTDDISRLELTVAAISAANTHLVAAKRRFDVTMSSEECRLRPDKLHATQIRSWWERSRLKRELRARLD